MTKRLLFQINFVVLLLMSLSGIKEGTGKPLDPAGANYQDMHFHNQYYYDNDYNIEEYMEDRTSEELELGGGGIESGGLIVKVGYTPHRKKFQTVEQQIGLKKMTPILIPRQKPKFPYESWLESPLSTAPKGKNEVKRA